MSDGANDRRDAGQVAAKRIGWPEPTDHRVWTQPAGGDFTGIPLVDEAVEFGGELPVELARYLDVAAASARTPEVGVQPSPRDPSDSTDGARHLSELREALTRAQGAWMPAVSADAVRWALKMIVELQQQRDAAEERARRAEASLTLAVDVLQALQGRR